jgi:hypothetical protein
VLGAVLTEFRAGLRRRFAIYARDIHSRAIVSAKHVHSLEWCEGWEDGLANAAVSTCFAVYHKSRDPAVGGLDYG